MSRRRRTAEPPVARDRWLVSYADFITLMFAFFTVLYASSTVDRSKLAWMTVSMQQVFTGVEPPGAPMAPAMPHRPAAVNELQSVHARLSYDLAPEIESGRLSVEFDARGVLISIREAGSFSTGSAELPPAAATVLDRVARRLREIPNAARVEGHTDDVPIRTERFASNWDLSTSRATQVIAYLVQHAGIDPARLSAAGYSQFRPRVPNDSDANRARNRRVDIVILNQSTRSAEEPRK